jgi:hypothetical protein
VKKIFLGALVCAFTLVSHATILPPNNLHLQDNVKVLSNVTEEMFTEMMETAQNIYAPIVALHGAELNIAGYWTSSTVNAYASQTGDTWKVRMYGGLARRKEVTPDGFMLVICHELGHHLAGFPFYRGGDWAASEGQSDYYATQSCAKKVWANDEAGNAKFRSDETPEFVKKKCDSEYHSKRAQNLCYRISMASFSLANLLGSLQNAGEIDFDTPSTSVVTTTRTSHPRAQCRLDTYFNGGLCKANFDITVIPGKGLDNQDGKDAELEAALYSCSHYEGNKEGLRPKCWFATQL